MNSGNNAIGVSASFMIFATKLSALIGGTFILAYVAQHGIYADVAERITITEIIVYGAGIEVFLIFLVSYGVFASYWIYLTILIGLVFMRRVMPYRQRRRLLHITTDTIYAEDRITKILFFLSSVSAGAIAIVVFHSLYNMGRNEKSYGIIIYMFSSGLMFLLLSESRRERPSTNRRLNLWVFAVPFALLLNAPIGAQVGPDCLRIVGLLPSANTTFVMNRDGRSRMEMAYALMNRLPDECTLTGADGSRWYFPHSRGVLYGVGDMLFLGIQKESAAGEAVVMIPTADIMPVRFVHPETCPRKTGPVPP